jgi:hypothetical protein
MMPPSADVTLMLRRATARKRALAAGKHQAGRQLRRLLDAQACRRAEAEQPQSLHLIVDNTFSECARHDATLPAPGRRHIRRN